MPRLMPSPWVVLPTPPGPCRRSWPPFWAWAAGAGSGIRSTRRSSSTTGAGLSMTWPEGTELPISIAFWQRKSGGSRPSAHQAGVRDDGRRAGGVGATVQVDLGPDVDQRAVLICAVLVADQGRMAVHVTEKRLFAAVDHLHRLARVQGEQAGVDVHGQVFATAERAADAREGEPDLLGREVERGADLALIDVQPLGGDEQVDAALAVGNREAGLGAQESLVLHAYLVAAFDHDFGFGVRVAFADLEVSYQVAAWMERG